MGLLASYDRLFALQIRDDERYILFESFCKRKLLFKLLKLSGFSNIAWFSWIHNNFTNLISEVLINLFKFNFRPECFFFKLVTKRNTHADKRNNLIKSLKCSIFIMFPVPNISFEIDTKVVDLFIISLPNSVINSASFFCVSISRFSFVHNVSSFISFKKKGPSHHKELLDRSWGRNLAAIMPQGWFYTFSYFNNSVLHK